MTMSELKVFFVRTSNAVTEVTSHAGQSLLDVAHAGGIEIEGACEGSMACSTCHVIVDEKWFSRLPAPSEEEQDMLDLTYGLTRTSRLGCQIRMTADLDGLTVALPSETHNMLE
jgi:2Fe-2S ferredoxin